MQTTVQIAARARMTRAGILRRATEWGLAPERKDCGVWLWSDATARRLSAPSTRTPKKGRPRR